MIKKSIGALLISMLISINFVSAYTEIDCSTDVVFDSYSCSQCFDGGTKMKGDYIGLLIDDWVNSSEKDQILWKEEQQTPEMYNLNPTQVAWSQTPSSEGFWEYTEEFDALYSDIELGYVLEAGRRITWLQSKIGYAYKLDNNSVLNNGNIGLLVYPISIHEIQEDGTPSIDDEEHNECVLFKSAGASEIEIPESPERLPDTGPTEYILLLIIAMLLGFGFIRLSSRS